MLVTANVMNQYYWKRSTVVDLVGEIIVWTDGELYGGSSIRRDTVSGKPPKFSVVLFIHACDFPIHRISLHMYSSSYVGGRTGKEIFLTSALRQPHETRKPSYTSDWVVYRTFSVQ
jgi:hypothetical protein